MDPYLNDSLIDKIVCEVKSQGAFDQFRRECIADVDTKPAYQNLRQRVENSVTTFLNAQQWKADLNKNQLRERLRRNITESGFLETGVERIVDQVVNPKINSVFLPTIEDISYKFLGIEKPKHTTPEQQPPPLPPLPPQPQMFSGTQKSTTNGLTVNTSGSNFLPNDLEAVSPDSDRSNANKSMDSHHKSDEEDNLNDSIESENSDILNESADKSLTEDFESPAFELIEGARSSSAMSMVDDGDGDNSKLSAISGLTSQDSMESCGRMDQMEEQSFNISDLSSIPPPPPPPPPPEEEGGVAPPPVPKTEIKEEQMDLDVQHHHDQNSILSQVSSNSRLSIVTSDSKSITVPEDHCEEAQMPKFNENSSNSHNANAGNVTAAHFDPTKERKPLLTSFDIKQDEITFEGTRRHSICLDIKAESAVRIKTEHMLNSVPLPMLSPLRPPSPLAPIPMPLSDPPVPPPPPSDEHHLSDDIKPIKTESMSSTCLIIFETKSLTLNDNDESVKHETPTPMDTLTSQSDFKFEEPVLDGGDISRDKTKDSSHKSRKRERSHHSSSSSYHRDKDRSSSDKDRKSTSSSRHSSSSSKDHRSSSSRREEKSSSSSKTSSSSRPSSSSKHHSSSSHRHHSSSSSKDRSRHESSSSKSSSSTSNHTHKAPSTHHRSEKSEEKSSSSRKSSESRPSPKKRDDNLSNGDDHFSQKIERRRSTDRDSNDDGHKPNTTEPSTPTTPSAPTAATSQSTTNSNGSTNSSISAQDQPEQPQDKPDIGQDQLDFTQDQLDLTQTQDDQSPHQTYLSQIQPQHKPIEPTQDFILPTLPVVVDDILTGCEEINLELLIKQETSDPVLSSIQQTLTGSGLKKPKVASNIHEARKLMKVRKQMEREEKKRMEQAIVLAKQYISSNSEVANSLGMTNNQGVELEFACFTSSDSPAPSISSPLKTNKPKPASTQVSGLVVSTKPLSDSDDFYGFEANIDSKLRAQQFVEDTKEHFTKCAESLRNHSDYSRSIYLHTPDAIVSQSFVDMFSGDVWRYSKGAAREAVVLRPTTVEFLVSRDNPSNSSSSAITQTKVAAPIIEGITKKMPASRKRKSTSSSSDNNNGSRAKKVRPIKVAATIQMTAVESEDCFEEDDEDDAQSMASDGCVATAAQVSPTPSEKSVSSKENNFVPKIKKAVSRSIAHNNTLNANIACVVAPICADDPHQVHNKANTAASGASSSSSTTSSSKASQRYSSDDLYKPRPILLGSRSRRRGFDASDM